MKARLDIVNVFTVTGGMHIYYLENTAMLRQQMDAQQARELARDYLAAVGMSGSPEDYMARVKALESHFLTLLKQVHKN